MESMGVWGCCPSACYCCVTEAKAASASTAESQASFQVQVREFRYLAKKWLPAASEV